MWYWLPNPGPLKERSVLFTAKLFLQHPTHFFIVFLLRWEERSCSWHFFGLPGAKSWRKDLLFVTNAQLYRWLVPLALINYFYLFLFMFASRLFNHSIFLHVPLSCFIHKCLAPPFLPSSLNQPTPPFPPLPSYWVFNFFLLDQSVALGRQRKQKHILQLNKCSLKKKTVYLHIVKQIQHK